MQKPLFNFSFLLSSSSFYSSFPHSDFYSVLFLSFPFFILYYFLFHLLLTIIPFLLTLFHSFLLLFSFLFFCFHTFLSFLWMLTNILFASVRPWWTLFSVMLTPRSNQRERLLNVKTFQKIFLVYHLTGMPTNLGALFIQ